MKLRLYQGTRANPTSIRELGLLAGGLDGNGYDPLDRKYIVNKEATLKRVLKEFNLEKGDVPEWTYKGELEYEQDLPTHIHFEMSFDNALGYADMGGEPAYVIRYYIACWIVGKIMSLLGHDPAVMPWNYDRDLHDQINRWAKEQNGPKRYVVVVEVDTEDPRVDPVAVEKVERIQRLVDEGELDEDVWKSPYEIRYFGDIPPDKIIGIVQV